MAHYDCKNCGTHMGIAWGFCGECTPREYLDLKREYEKRFNEIVEDEMRKHREYASKLAHTLLKDLKEKMEEFENGEK